MIAQSISAAMHSLWRAKLRTGLSVLAVALGIGMMLLSFTQGAWSVLSPLTLLGIVLAPSSNPGVMLSGAAVIMSSVAAMSLGIASVMERRLEFQVRRVYGATGKHILVQILGEMVGVIVVGGILGVAGVQVILYSQGMQTNVVTLADSALLLAVLVLGGIVVGAPPALQAILYDPAD